MRVLIVEDDTRLAAHVAAALTASGLSVDLAGSVAAADEKAWTTEYDAMVLDRMLPDGDSLGLLARLRARDDTTPVIVLTARADLPDRLAGLDGGADDYLAKPFALPELLARLRALGRRPRTAAPPVLRLGDLELDPASMRVSRTGRELVLTAKEFALLEHLLRNAGRVVSRSELVEHCWDEFADPASNVVDVRIRLLRGKLGDPPLVHTVRGAGYVAEERPR
ncbi:response regulator transcription factor [Phycicoccus sonneratiae]|uniref:Response regulator transcription factor n=1 Tax=Phycicoccus sonneratiae TaxID=2807628 RepID=A0ABS2CQW7_9MICO|nr:response regulator transcription factor [Phycicoccus sonneraticus]MBM6402284.1 response regulator transcription factor [Phycicoccus sonneraticus]